MLVKVWPTFLSNQWQEEHAICILTYTRLFYNKERYIQAFSTNATLQYIHVYIKYKHALYQKQPVTVTK